MAGLNNTRSAAGKASQDFAYTAAAQLRKEFKDSYNIKARVTVVSEPGRDSFLAVEFGSWEDYEQIKDLFYQDPGDNPSYMGVKISPRVSNRDRGGGGQ